MLYMNSYGNDGNFIDDDDNKNDSIKSLSS